MKKTMLFITATIAALSLNGQTVFVPNGTSGIGTSSNGNVGIGTTSPSKTLDVAGKVYLFAGRNGDPTLKFNNSGWARIGGSSSSGLAIWGTGNAETDDNPTMVVASGNVGIGTTSPEAKLSINTQAFDGNASSSYPTASSRGDIVQFIETNNNGIEIGNGKGCNDRKAWILARHSDLNYIMYGTFYSTLHLQPDVGNKVNYEGVAIGYSANTRLTTGTHLAVNGKLGIGTTSPDQMLTVKGKIHAEELIVDLNVPLADYVFGKDYELMPLHQVDQYVQENSHLPEMPSATEVKDNGLGVGEMQNKLLKKVEELTLYLIQQDKRIKALEEENQRLKGK